MKREKILFIVLFEINISLYDDDDNDDDIVCCYVTSVMLLRACDWCNNKQY